MNWDKIDIDMTPLRINVKNLQTHLGIGASRGCFDCKHFKCCHASISNQPILKGDWTYVGHQYGEALVGGKKAKILFVSMDRTGTGKKYEKFDQTQKEFRSAAYERTNPHMGGVDVELKYLLDNETSCEDRCQQFALTNSVRCRPRSNSAASQSTSEMKRNCASHTQAIIKALEPDIIIAQGAYPREGLHNLFSPNIVNTKNNIGRYKQYRSAEIGQAEIQGKKCLFLLTAHPAHYPGFSWKKGYLPYELKEIFAQAREIYSSVQQSYCIEETNVLDQTQGSHHSREDRFFNTNETNAPGAYRNMFDQGVIAIYGFASGPTVFERCVKGQRVFAYVNRKGVLAVGSIVDDQAIRGKSVFAEQGEFHVRIKWETIVAEALGIKLKEVNDKFGYGLPVRNIFCRMSRPDIADWTANELHQRKASHGNP